MEEALSTYDEILKVALALPHDERVMLAEHLIASLDNAEQARIDALWVQEAERRYKEIEDGVVKAIPGEEVMSRLQSRYTDPHRRKPDIG